MAAIQRLKPWANINLSLIEFNLIFNILTLHLQFIFYPDQCTLLIRRVCAQDENYQEPKKMYNSCLIKQNITHPGIHINNQSA